MLELADFSSLFQFGAAVALAVSVFKSPMERKIHSFEARLRNDDILIGAENNERNERLREAVLDFRVDLALAAERARAAARLPMITVGAGAAINFLLLVWATLAPDHAVTSTEAVVLLIISVGTYVAGLCWLELITANEITSLRNQYDLKK